MKGRKSSVARTEARQSFRTFYQGKPCKKGHDGSRYTKSATCVQCQRECERKLRRQRAAAGAIG